jgi:hypothetical protein
LAAVNLEIPGQSAEKSIVVRIGDWAVKDTLLLNNAEPVERALGLLSRAIAILDSENLQVAAAKVDEARWAIRRTNAKLDALFLAERL